MGQMKQKNLESEARMQHSPPINSLIPSTAFRPSVPKSHLLLSLPVQAGRNVSFTSAQRRLCYQRVDVTPETVRCCTGRPRRESCTATVEMTALLRLKKN